MSERESIRAILSTTVGENREVDRLVWSKGILRIIVFQRRPKRYLDQAVEGRSSRFQDRLAEVDKLIPGK